MERPRIGIDGRVLLQGVTGVQRVAREMVTVLTGILGDRLTLLIPSVRSKYAQHLWEHFVLASHIRRMKIDSLLCPATLVPLRVPPDLRVVTIIHDLSYLYFPYAYSPAFRTYYRALMPHVLRRSDIIVTVSHAERERMLSFYPHIAHKLRVIPNGVNSNDFYDERRRRESVILYVGSLSQRKNFYGALKAFSLVLSDLPHTLVVIGSMSDIFTADLRVTHLLQEIPQERVLFVGQLNAVEELRAWYGRASCLLYPSFYESSGLPPSEAMACGCPVIAANIPSLRERCGDAALYCNPHNVREIAERLVLLETAPQLKEQLVEQGRVRARNFSWQRMAEQLLELLEGGS